MTARKRISRGIERIRKILSRQATSHVNADAITAGLTLAAGQRASATTGTAIHTSVLSGAVTPTILSLSKGTLMAMAWAKLKIAAVIAAGLVVTGGLGAGIIQWAAASTPPPTGAAAPTTSAATLPASSASHTFFDGIDMQIVAIGEQATGQWWLPDGSPTQSPYPASEFHSTRSPTLKSCAIGSASEKSESGVSKGLL